ncbi:MAG: DUF1207 domain-containing protein [Ignavibacteriaceae bacterium]|nr:DUF1207 domain-containing protein [Ignavibacteriaceae bacterium]
MNLTAKVLILIMIYSTFSASQTENQKPGFEFLPENLNFLPLRANQQETRIGVWYHTTTTNLKVDIGNSIDLLSFFFPEIDAQLTLGIDFTAYALSTSYGGNRLQIDAVDGFFGGNASFTKKSDGNKYQARLRILHHSAHLVDGHYDLDLKQWIDNREPIPFTKDFGELTIAHVINSSILTIRYYSGFAYSTLVRPDELKRYSLHAGVEFSTDKIFGKVFKNDVNLFISHHFNLGGARVYSGNNNSVLGIKFGSWNGKGIVIYSSYYNGSDVFSNYYNRRVSKFGIGFNIEFN